jgi:hypothetical protein
MVLGGFTKINFCIYTNGVIFFVRLNYREEKRNDVISLLFFL